jgi:hypothetical protein
MSISPHLADFDVDPETKRILNVALEMTHLSPRRCRMMANVRADPAEPSPELSIPNAAAQTRMVSVTKIRLDRHKSTRPYK